MTESSGFKKVLFCTDFSENADAAFLFARDFAERNKGLLYILHVVPPNPYLMYAYMNPENSEKMDREMAKYLEESFTTHYVQKMKRGARFKIVTKTGREQDEILAFAKEENVDVIVMGTHGRTGIEHVFFGSVAEKILRHSPFPLFVIPCKKKRERT
jgi:nucleotide-binding universal stress UspA family protein